MKTDIKNSQKLIKWIYYIPLISIVLTIVVVATIFIYKENQIYKNDILFYKKKLLKQQKLDARDRVLKLAKQIEFNKNILLEESKENVKNLVDFAYKIIQQSYKDNKIFGKEYTLNVIRDRLRHMRFFDNLSGYFYMYKMDGTCLLLPTNPSYEGKNLLNVKDAKGTKIVKKAITILRKKGKAFDSWYWYKPGEKVMKKKIGYFRVFKPLDIYIGSAFYVEDIMKKAKKIALKIIRDYRYNTKGYIFAYDFKGNTLSHIKKSLIGTNRINLVLNHRHIVKEMIRGAKINEEGFFMSYLASLDPLIKKPVRKISYIKALKDFDWIIGTGFYVKDIRNIAKDQYTVLQNELNRVIKYIFVFSFIMIIILGSIMLAVSNKIKRLIQEYEENLLRQYQETINQKKIFQLLFDKSKDGIFLDSDEKFLDCNDSAVKMFGAKDKEHLLSQSATTLSPKFQPDGKPSRQKMVAIFKEARKNGVYRGEWFAKRLDGSTFWIEMVVTPINIEGNIVYHTIFRDISQRKRIEKELKTNEAKLAYKARHDSLTNLPNRFMFGEIITHAILKAKREDKKVAVLFLDFDGFKDINDFYGHDMGDMLLIEATKRLKDEIRQSDYLFRFGGDEFVFLFSDFSDIDDVVRVAQKLNNAFSFPFSIKEHLIKVGISIGISVYPDDGLTSEELLRNADIAMYKAKEQGKNRYVFFEDRMYRKIMQRHLLEEQMRKAIKNDEFIVHYQPQVDIKHHKVVGLEALVRWEKDGAIVPPGQFIPIASQCNLIQDIGDIVIKKAIKFASYLHQNGLNVEKISINLDDKQLKNPNLLDIIANYLKVFNCPPGLIEFEITEGFVMNDLKVSYALLKEIRDMGCSVSIDDFGTGYSSLAYIKNLPFDVIKIDQSFVKDIIRYKEDKAIVNTIIELGKGLGLKVIAEGIETKEQEEFLFEKGCYIIQGYLYSRPLPENKIKKFINQFKRREA